MSRLPSGGLPTHPSSLISLLEIKRPLTPNPVAHFDCRSRVFVVVFVVLLLAVVILLIVSWSRGAVSSGRVVIWNGMPMNHFRIIVRRTRASQQHDCVHARNGDHFLNTPNYKYIQTPEPDNTARRTTVCRIQCTVRVLVHSYFFRNLA
jgi:hypothetical protein